MRYLILLILALAISPSSRALIPGCGDSSVYDQSQCGATSTILYTSIDPAITSLNGTQITGCNFTFVSSTNYFLAGNIGSNLALACLTLTGLSNINIDLGGFTVTGGIQLSTNSGRNQNIHIYNGSLPCTKTGGSTPLNTCLGLNNNQVTTVTGAFKLHHLTIQNFFDSGTDNINSTGTPFAVGGDLGHNTIAGDIYELYFQYNTILMTNNNYASGRTGAVQIIGGLAPNLYSNNLITIGGGEAASQGIVAYGHVGGSKLNNNFANLALSLYNSPNVSSRAFMFDASQGTTTSLLEVAFNGGVINDHRCVRVRDSPSPSIHDNYFQTIRFGGASGGNNGTLGCFHMGDPNSFPSSAISNINCGPAATAIDGCVITLSGSQNWVGHEGDVITYSQASPSSLIETVTITTGNPTTPNIIKYASHNPANNNVTSTGPIAFVYSNTMNGVISNNKIQVDCSVNKQGIVFGQRAANNNLYLNNIISTNGDCTTSFTGALFKRYLNAAVDNFTLKSTTFTNQLGGVNYSFLTTSNGPSGLLQRFGYFCSTLGLNGVTDGDLGWATCTPLGISGSGIVSGAGALKNP